MAARHQLAWAYRTAGNTAWGVVSAVGVGGAANRCHGNARADRSAGLDHLGDRSNDTVIWHRARRGTTTRPRSFTAGVYGQLRANTGLY